MGLAMCEGQERIGGCTGDDNTWREVRSTTLTCCSRHVTAEAADNWHVWTVNGQWTVVTPALHTHAPITTEVRS